MKFNDNIFEEMQVFDGVNDFVERNNDGLWVNQNPNEDANYEILESLAQNEMSDDCNGLTDDELDNMKIDEMNSIIRVLKFSQDSLLFDGLIEWYGTRDNMLKNIRSCIQIDNGWHYDYYFVTGVGYDTISSDLLGGQADGLAKKEFIEMLNKNEIKA